MTKSAGTFCLFCKHFFEHFHKLFTVLDNKIYWLNKNTLTDIFLLFFYQLIPDEFQYLGGRRHLQLHGTRFTCHDINVVVRKIIFCAHEHMKNFLYAYRVTAVSYVVGTCESQQAFPVQFFYGFFYLK